MDRIQKLFTNLAGRMTSENDLSDFVWALCQSNEGFKQFFLDFFFKNKLKAAEYAVDREVSCKGGRPDFVITRLGKCKDRYFVEVKKDDASHHFKQYLEELKKDGHGIERLGYITLYALERNWLEDADRDVAWDENKCRWNCQYRTWGDFLKKLYACVEKADDWAKGDDVRGLCAFVKVSCRVDELVSSFTLDKKRVGRVKAFAQALDEVVQVRDLDVGGGKVSLRRYDFIRDYEWSLGHLGRCFSAKGLVEGKEVRGWLGSYFTKEDGALGLTLEFENTVNWGAPIFDDLKSKEEILSLNVPLSLHTDVEEMKNEIMKSLSKMLADLMNKKTSSTHDDNANTPDELLDVKRIRLFIDQNVFVNKDDVKVEFYSENVPNDDFSSAGWVGRYKHVRIDNWTQLIWLGVRYDGEKLYCLKNGRPKEVAKTADGSQLILEVGDKRYVVGVDAKWEASAIRKRLYEMLKEIQKIKN